MGPTKWDQAPPLQPSNSDSGAAAAGDPSPLHSRHDTGSASAISIPWRNKFHRRHRGRYGFSNERKGFERRPLSPPH